MRDGLDYESDYMHIITNVKNIGECTGKQVIQVYLKIPEGKLEQPIKRLVGFAKTKELNPGESQKLTLYIKGREFASYDESRTAWIAEAGNYVIEVATSVNMAASVLKVNLDHEFILRTTENIMQPTGIVDVFSKKKNNYPKGAKSGIKEGIDELCPRRIPKHYQISQDKTKDVQQDLVSRMSVQELARISICADHGWGMQETGVAGKLYRYEKYDMPIFEVADGNNGLNIHKPNIGMPCSSVVCASWNQELAYHVGKTIAEEAAENQVAMVLAPAMNLHRNPLGGRNPEYFSEDPYLTGVMAGLYVKGIEKNGASASMKHVIANNCEASRKRNQSIIDVRTMRELYLKSFEIAMDVHMPDSIMTSYNAVNGCFTAEDKELLEGIFRKEFGFTGFVMTDWNSYDTADLVRSVQAGNSWMTPGSLDDTYTNLIVDGVKNEKIEIEQLRKNVRDMLRIVENRTQTWFL